MIRGAPIPLYAATTLLVILVTTGAAEAADGKKKVLTYEAVPMSERESRNDMGSCLLLSHDCEICASDDQDNIVCSSVGIACVSTERRCYHYVEEPK